MQQAKDVATAVDTSTKLVKAIDDEERALFQSAMIGSLLYLHA